MKTLKELIEDQPKSSPLLKKVLDVDVLISQLALRRIREVPNEDIWPCCQMFGVCTQIYRTAGVDLDSTIIEPPESPKPSEPPMTLNQVESRILLTSWLLFKPQQRLKVNRRLISYLETIRPVVHQAVLLHSGVT